MESTFSKSLVQVEEVLKYLNKEDLKKIPNHIVNFINKNKSKSFSWNIDKSKKLSEQDLELYAVAFLSYINLKYLANKEQRMFLEKLYTFNDKKIK